MIRQITVNDLPVGRSVDEVLRLVKAFHFVDKHGEGIIFSIFIFVKYLFNFFTFTIFDFFYLILLLLFFSVCPANWHPNSPTIKPNPDASKEYFSKVNK